MIYAVVLAAGLSRRMGAQKLLLPFAGRTIIAHIVDEVLQAPLAGAIVVVRAEGKPVVRALASRPVTFVANEDASGDMLSSVRTGLRALPAGCRGVLVVLGDQPGITAALITDMLAAFNAGSGGIVVPACAGRRGHPLLFSTRFAAEVLAAYDGVGLRGLLAAHAGEVYELRVPAALEDMDTPEEYRRELRRLQP